MIVHCVFLKLADPADAGACAAVLDRLCAFAAGLEGVISASAGPNIDLEGKSPEFPAGFVVNFKDRAALVQYAAHPEHKELGAQLVALCRGGAAGIVVFDLDCPDP